MVTLHIYLRTNTKLSQISLPYAQNGVNIERNTLRKKLVLCRVYNFMASFFEQIVTRIVIR
jgi:hypothetical protein